MLTMLTTFWQGITSKLGLFVIVALAVLAGVAKVFTAGRTKERLAQAETALRNNAKEAKVNAQVDRLATDTVRDRMLNKWSRR